MAISLKRAAELLRVRYENDSQVLKIIVGNLLEQKETDPEIINSLKRLGIEKNTIEEALESLKWDAIRINESFEEARRKDVNLHVLLETV